MIVGKMRSGVLSARGLDVGIWDKDPYEPTFIRYKRKWSNSEFIVWLQWNTTCTLGCRYCHEYETRHGDWITAPQVKERLEAIGNGANCDIAVSLGDPFLSPSLVQILDYCASAGHTVMLYSYLPQSVDLTSVRKLLHKYGKTVCICYSLHGWSDKFRSRMFRDAQSIAGVLELLQEPHPRKHAIYFYSHLVTP